VTVAVSPEDAHEINNLLVYVILGLELIEREANAGCSREKINELVKDALDGAEKLRALVRQLRAPLPELRVTAARPRLLLIDDDPRLGQTLSIGLGDRAELVQARTGAEALGMLPGFDLVLCDINLPDIPGMDVYDRAPPDLRAKFVFTTGGAITDRAREFLATAPRLDKPFRLEQLEAVLFTGPTRPAPD
jgi:CheY-like chemotaxis protein